MSGRRPSSAYLPENHAMSRPPLPPITEETAIKKVRAAEDAQGAFEQAKQAAVDLAKTHARV